MSGDLCVRCVGSGVIRTVQRDDLSIDVAEWCDVCGRTGRITDRSTVPDE